MSDRLGKKNVYVFLDFRVVIIKKGEIVEASFMMTKCPKNDFKIESTSSGSSLISSFKKRNQEDSRIKRSLISRFKRR